jgi:hypothetical protein
MEPTAAQRAALDKITAEIAAAVGPALPGTLTVRAYACGKPGCRCHAYPPRLHGPYAEWTRKIGGTTITRRLTPRQLAEYQPLFDNAKKLRALLSELQDLTLQIIETGSTHEPAAPPEPEPSAPENVGEARLTCGQPSSQTPFAQVSPKREDLARHNRSNLRESARKQRARLCSRSHDRHRIRSRIPANQQLPPLLAGAATGNASCFADADAAVGRRQNRGLGWWLSTAAS